MPNPINICVNRSNCKYVETNIQIQFKYDFTPERRRRRGTTTTNNDEVLSLISRFYFALKGIPSGKTARRKPLLKNMPRRGATWLLLGPMRGETVPFDGAKMGTKVLEGWHGQQILNQYIIRTISRIKKKTNAMYGVPMRPFDKLD